MRDDDPERVDREETNRGWGVAVPTRAFRVREKIAMIPRLGGAPATDAVIFARGTRGAAPVRSSRPGARRFAINLRARDAPTPLAGWVVPAIKRRASERPGPRRPPSDSPFLA